MQISRRQVLGAIGAFSLGAVLTSCAGFVRPASTPATGELTFTTWGSDSELVGFRKAIAGFESANPGAKITLNVVPYQQIYPTVDAQLQSNTAPDIFRVDYRNFGRYAGSKQLLNLEPLLDASVGASFTDALWRAVQFDGKPYGVPHHTDTTAILYNKAAFAAAGITSVPTTLETAWTWDEFEKVALTLQRKLPAGKYPFAYNWQGQGAARWLNWLFQADGRFLDKKLRSPAIDSEAGRAAIDFTKSFFTRKLVPANNSVKSSTYASDLFFSETVAMTFAGAFLIPDAAKLANFEWGATFSPRDKRGGGDLGGNALVATAGTAKKTLAAKFLAYMVGQKTMRDFCATSSLLPTRKDLVAKGIEFTVRPELSKIFVGQASTVRAADTAQVASPAMGAITTVLSDQLEQAFICGQSTKDTLAGMTAGITQALSR